MRIRRAKPKIELQLEKAFSKLWKEFKKDAIAMFNWWLFYKPTGKLDKIIHIFEVICVYIVLQMAFNSRL